jgi:hypothetical protein
LDAPRTAQDKLNALFKRPFAVRKATRFVERDQKAANEARIALETLLLNSVSHLLRLALDDKETDAKQWAGMLLARFTGSIEKHDEEKGKHARELSKTNAAYLAEKAKIGKLRVDVLFPKPIGKAVRQELRTAERYRNRLLVLHDVCRRDRAGGKNLWKHIAMRQNIPEEYFGTVDLPEFSVKAEPQWWKFLWPLIKKHNPNLLIALRGGKIPTRGIRCHTRWASYGKEFRNVLRTLAWLRSGGVL